MKVQFTLASLLCIALCFFVQPARAGYYAHNSHAVTIRSEQPNNTTAISNSAPAREPVTKQPNGTVAYLAAGAAVLGLILASANTLLLVLLLGLFAGICGAGGLKRYKHDKFYRALCYVGIIGGAVCVFLASVPALFLVK